MANMLARLLGRADETRFSLEDYNDWANQFQFGGLWYAGLQETLNGGTAEPPQYDFMGRAAQAFGGNGVVFSVMLVRQLIFSAVRFRWQRMRDGRPSDTFSSAALDLFDHPWPGGTTQDLLNRVIQDADLAGNGYNTLATPLVRLDGDRGGQEIVRLRPDWVSIAVADFVTQSGRLIGQRRIGYWFTEGGLGSGNEPEFLERNEVSHFAPIPDPLARFRGMSWLTPVVREIQADELMTRHRRMFFEHGATPNMIVKHDTGANLEKVKRWVEEMREKYGGLSNAYKTMHLYPGADATVIGKDMRQIDFKGVQGAGETRIAAAGGMPPVIVGLSEGLQAATYSNYGQARRRLADGTMHPLWQNATGSFAVLMPAADDARLWYDARDVPFLREDEKDASVILQTRAETINGLIVAGFTPDSAVKAVESGDLGLLEHTGMFSVQLQPPGSVDVDPRSALVVTNVREAAELITRGWRRVNAIEGVS